MNSTSPPAESPCEFARRILYYGLDEAVKMARAKGVRESDIKAAAATVAKLLMMYSAIKPASPPPKLRLVRPPSTQLRLPLE